MRVAFLQARRPPGLSEHVHGRGGSIEASKLGLLVAAGCMAWVAREQHALGGLLPADGTRQQ